MSIKPYELQSGNCKELIKQLADNTIDAIITDPPYELGFLGKKWDATGIAYDAELWAECLRVLKPGGHLLAFSGSRTYHRMTVAIEDAGFDIRDQIMWIYGSGFPKSHNVAKGIDKARGFEGEIIGQGVSWNRPDSAEGDVVRTIFSPGVYDIKELSAEAKVWNGWGTALKPAHEPICVARKPFIGTVAENVLQYGTGAFNIDGCRVVSEQIKQRHVMRIDGGKNCGANEVGAKQALNGTETVTQGRWPANLIHDGSAEVLAGFPETAKDSAHVRNPNGTNGKNYVGDFGLKAQPDRVTGYNEPRGSAARFFYCAKASKRDRDEGCGELEERARQTMGSGMGRQPDQNNTNNRNHHPTVKPTELMRYLCRLVTPPNGLILDPFTGSGSTGKAAMLEGFRFLGFEMEPQYIEIATARIEYAIEQKSKQKTEQENTLFGAENE